MFDFANAMVFIGGLSLLLFPLLLKMKRPFRLIFIFCGLGSVTVAFLDDVIQLDPLAVAFLAIPLVVAWIKKGDMLKKRNEGF